MSTVHHTEVNALALPLYASKPKRRIPGTRFVAVTMYKSADGSVQDVAIISADGTAMLGTVHLHQKRGWRPRCWSLDSVYRVQNDAWGTLGEYVVEMAKRNGIEA